MRTWDILCPKQQFPFFGSQVLHNHRAAAPTLVRRILFPFLFCISLMLAGCGGGNSGGGTPPPSSPDFTLTLSSSNVTITGGGTASLSVTVNGEHGFNSAVTFSLAGLPNGITTSPTTLESSPGSPLTLTFSATASAAAASANVTLTGVSGSLSHTSQIGVTVKSPPLPPPSFRTKYVRTDAATEYFGEPNSNWMVFDPVTHRFFVSDPGSNQIEVLDSASETKIGSIAVPGAYGIDETPDHSVIYAGTQIGDVYAIDPGTMTVTHRYMAAQIGPSGFQTYAVRVLASGALALLGAQGGLPGVDGYGSIGVWNPSTNALTVNNNFSHIQGFTLTGNRALIVFLSGGLCTLDPGTGNSACADLSNFGVHYSVATTPDGKSILVPYYSPGQVVVFDAKSLTRTSSFAVNADTSAAASMIVSPDSKTLYMIGGGFVYAYDIASGTQIGWLSSLAVPPISAGGAAGPVDGPNLQAFDNTGLLAGPMEEGVGFLDTAALKTGPMGTQFLNDYIVPATGPAAGGTATQFENVSAGGVIGMAYFGENLATDISQANAEFYATTPSGSPGPVDVYAQMRDGGTLIVPEGFSYGPTILQVTPDKATAEGGGTGIIYGYGFGSTANNAPIPSDLQITVDGRTATVTGFAPNAYGISSPPFNLQAVAFTIPQGTAGLSADVTVTTANGTTKAAAALSYLPPIQQFALPGAALAQGVYDSARNLYYFTNTSEIEVFSRLKGQWQAPIRVPAPPPGTTHRLWGIALSEDGSKLVVSDDNAAMIYVLNPGSPGSVQSFPVSTYNGGSPVSYPGIITQPSGLAVSNLGMVYFAAIIIGGSGFDGFFKLDTNTAKVTDYGIESFAIINQFRAAISADNSRVFFNNDGSVFSVDTASDKVSYASVDPGCCYGDYDLTFSASQNTVEATGYLYDASLNAESYLVMNDREAMNNSYIYGVKLSADGKMLFQPSTNGIDIFDGRVGNLLTRISLPAALSQNFDALVNDGTDNVLVAITGQTGTGIAIVDLTSVTEPLPLPYIDAGSLAEFPLSQPAHPVRSASVAPGQHVPVTVIRHLGNPAIFGK